jgi:hypothetical protein
VELSPKFHLKLLAKSELFLKLMVCGTQALRAPPSNDENALLPKVNVIELSVF